MQQQFNGRVLQALLRVLHLTQQKVSVPEQHVLSPVGEVQQQTLQGILGNESEFIIHVDRQPAERRKKNNQWQLQLLLCF